MSSVLSSLSLSLLCLIRLLKSATHRSIRNVYIISDDIITRHSNGRLLHKLYDNPVSNAPSNTELKRARYVCRDREKNL